jgi:prophage maintenance system killer protein
VALPDYLITGSVIDAIHAQLSFAMGRDVSASGFRLSGEMASDFDADAVVEEVALRIGANPGYDACWVAALYAVLLAPNLVYKSSNAATALVSVCVVLSRAGLRLMTDNRDFLAAMQAVRGDSFSTPLHEGFAEWLRRRCV